MTSAVVRTRTIYFTWCEACREETGPFQERATGSRAAKRHNRAFHPRAPPPPERRRRTTADPRLRCPKCRSGEVMKAGLRPCKAGTNQVYRCRDCGRNFSGDDDRFRRRFPKWVRARAVELLARGVSVRKTARRLKAEFGVDVGKSSVARWERETAAPREAAGGEARLRVAEDSP